MPSMTSRLTLSVLLLAPIAAVPAFAQAEPSDGSTASDTILVTGQLERDSLTTANATGSRLDLTLLETPASISVLTGELIRARGDQSIIDAQSRAVGITNVGNPGNGGTALAARGFAGQGSVLQLIDGVRLFPVAGTVTFPTDPWMAERIDILNGPASVLYGQGALGAAVNVIMRQPNSERMETEGEIGYGSQNTFHAAAGVGGPLSDPLAVRVDASYRRSDGYVDRGDSHSLALSGTLRWTPSETLTFTLRNDYGDIHPTKYFGTPLIDGKLDTRIRERNYNVGDARMRSEDNRTTFQIDWSPSEAITISNQVYRLTSHRLWRNLETYCWIGADGDCPNGYNGMTGTPGDIYRADNFGIGHHQTQWGDQGTITLRTPLGSGIDNALVAGFDVNAIKLRYDHDFNGDYQEDFVNPFAFDPGIYLNSVDITPQYRTRTREYAFFAEDRLQLSEQVSLVGGIRYESNRVRRWTIGATGDTLAFEKRLHNTTWRIGGVYQPTPDISLYAQYTTGVDPLGTLTTYSGGQVAFSHATGNQVEVGAKARFLDGRGTATIAAYRLVKNGLLSQKTPASPIEQVGQRSAKGIEATVSLDLPGGFGIDANGTILDARFDDFMSGGASYNGNDPAGVAERTANLWLRWDATASLQARAGLRYVGPRFSDDSNTFRVPGYATVDATLSYALSKNVALDVHLYNLFDKDYAITTYNDEQWVLGRPQSFDVSLRASF
ncbi:MAG: TonB-dependent receptor [Sphingobium sp. 66-54]|nr:MAG: TonB-dependent receptor [Sphingobium sp. 66-54]